MQGKRKRLVASSAFAVLLFGLITSLYAASPLWIFKPETPVDISLTPYESAQIRYTVFNQSFLPKNLAMRTIAGITQSSACQLPAKGSCTLTLEVSGANLKGDVFGGPILCQQGNSLQCYQPSSIDSLRIHLREQPPPIKQFTVTPLAGANGSILPTEPQVVNEGSSLNFTATADPGFGVNQWLLDDNVAQHGGTSFQLNNIQANHTVQVTFWQTTLSPLSQNLVLSVNNPTADPPLIGTPRIVRIENTGSVPANDVQVSTTGLPTGTAITNNTCTGTLNAGDTCDITLTPGNTASADASNNACTTAPGTEPVAGTITVSANNALSTEVSLLVLGYGCIYQGGFLFAVDDTLPNTESIGGKVAAITDEAGTLAWSAGTNKTTPAQSITNGQENTDELEMDAGIYPAAQSCFDKNDENFNDWYLPAICELGRYVGSGENPGCSNTNPNLYVTLKSNGLGNFTDDFYWSSTNVSLFGAYGQTFSNSGPINNETKGNTHLVRCIRTFTP